MINNTKNRQVMTCLSALIFSSCRHAAADVALGLVDIKQLPHLMIQCGVNCFQSLCEILVYGAFGDPELLCRCTDGSLVLNNVHRQIAGAFLDICMHIHHSPWLTYSMYMYQGEQI